MLRQPSTPKAATVGSLREIECTSEGNIDVSLKQSTRRAWLAGRMPSSLRRNSKYLMASYTKSLPESIVESNGDASKSSHSHLNSVAGRVTTTQTAQLVDNECCGQGAELVTMQLLLDDKGGDSGNTNGPEEDGTDTTCSESCCSIPSPEDALAIKVGCNAHEYLEECFHTDDSVFDREKFNAIPEIDRSDFTVMERLGTGSFSDVFEVVCKRGKLFDTKMTATPGATQLNRRLSTRGRSTRPSQCGERQQHVFAMKCLRPQIRSNADQFTVGAEDQVRETAILANLNHQHIIKLHGRAFGHLTNAFMLNDGYFILLDRLTETLHDRIDTWKRTDCILEGPTVKQMEVAHSIADAMLYLHSKKIVFRDLKPDNVGFDSKGVLKLFDFGFVTGLPEKDESNPAGLLYERCGTLRYMAPEVGLSLGYGTEADVYSFGILLWEICAWMKPFPSLASLGEFENAVFSGGKRPVIRDRWPTIMKELISSCWSAVPSERQTMLDIKSSLSLMMTNIISEKKAPIKTCRFRISRRR